MAGRRPIAQRLRAGFTVKNVLATAAFVAALTGTSLVAVAGTTPGVTGASVKDGSLTGRDIKDKTLEAATFSTNAQNYLKRVKGALGPVGFTGAQGDAGLRGIDGERGPDAMHAYSYIHGADTTGLVTDRGQGSVNPANFTGSECGHAGQVACGSIKRTYTGNGTFSTEAPVAFGVYPIWNYCGTNTGSYCHEGSTIGQGGGNGATYLDRLPTQALSFNSDDNGGYLTLMGPGNIVVTGSLTFLHPLGDYHSRVSCQPEARLAIGTNGQHGSFTPLGVPTTISAYQTDKLAHMTLTGAHHFDEPGDYDFQVTCHTVDDYRGNDTIGNWIFLQGNATALSTEL